MSPMKILAVVLAVKGGVDSRDRAASIYGESKATKKATANKDSLPLPLSPEDRGHREDR